MAADVGLRHEVVDTVDKLCVLDTSSTSTTQSSSTQNNDDLRRRKDKLERKLKRLCRSSDVLLRLAFSRLLEKLSHRSFDIRRRALEVMDILFCRSHLFRELAAAQFDRILSLSVPAESSSEGNGSATASLQQADSDDIGSDVEDISLELAQLRRRQARRNPHTGQSSSSASGSVGNRAMQRDRLRQHAISMFAAWKDKFGQAHRQISLGYAYLQRSAPLSVQSFQSSEEAERNQQLRRQSQQRASFQQELHAIGEEARITMTELDTLLTVFRQAATAGQPATSANEDQSLQEAASPKKPASNSTPRASTLHVFHSKNNDGVVNEFKSKTALLFHRLLPRLQHLIANIHASEVDQLDAMEQEASDLLASLQALEQRCNKVVFTSADESGSDHDDDETDDELSLNASEEDDDDMEDVDDTAFADAAVEESGAAKVSSAKSRAVGPTAHAAAQRRRRRNTGGQKKQSSRQSSNAQPSSAATADSAAAAKGPRRTSSSKTDTGFRDEDLRFMEVGGARVLANMLRINPKYKRRQFSRQSPSTPAEDETEETTPKRIKRESSGTSSQAQVASKSTQDLKRFNPEQLKKLRETAPTVEYGPDLEAWGKQVFVPGQATMSLHRFYANKDEDAIELPPSMDTSSMRTEFLVPKRKAYKACRYPMKTNEDGSVQLCPRRDAKICPFHGPIVPRDEQGRRCDAAEDSQPAAAAAEAGEDQVQEEALGPFAKLVKAEEEQKQRRAKAREQAAKQGKVPKRGLSVKERILRKTRDTVVSNIDPVLDKLRKEKFMDNW